MVLRELGDAQLRQLMKGLWHEVAQRELTTSPIGPPFGHWRAPAGEGDADSKDGEVTLQRENGALVRHHCSPQAPLEWRRMLVTSSAPSQPD